ncbi:PROTEIN NRT1/ PTR FAMILY 8.3 [Salix purpurea]|uniref:PROTEIN NRT1/ PTR FAMILY 8.3 n=1 Tax=Salix purpurea TaxID=77065 RepID=A0A9Q0WPD3_SALPP|nr:PROTEIN NRT1/ PTR FAMILY 8.3 [Salix purpurea]
MLGQLSVSDIYLQNENNGVHTGDGSVDINGKPVLKQKTGNWKACSFILGNECCERLAYYGIATNLVTYLTGKLHEGNVSAAKNVNIWAGTCYFTPLIGATLADAYWGRYWTIFVFSTIYFIGMCTLTLSATIPVLKPSECIGSLCPPATPAQYGIFFFGLYLIALGTGGIKPCVSSFGADQFDDTDPMERVKKGSFFNWFYFSINIGSLVSSSLMVYVQDKAGWGLGFGIPALFMGVAIATFFSGTPLYRFQRPAGSPVTRMCQVMVASFRKRNLKVPQDSSLLYETQEKHSAIDGTWRPAHGNELKCLDKAAIMSEAEIKSGDFTDPWRLCTVTQLQGSSLAERGAFQICSVWGIGLFISMLSMTAAALLEIKRLQLVKELGLVDDAGAVPLSIFWQIPQYMLIGTAEIFTAIGQIEFFYEQSPDSMRSLCSALGLLTTSLGDYLSSCILSTVTYFTTTGGKTGWIPDNLNMGHLDYLFWLLAGLSFFNLLIYTVSAMRYKEKRTPPKAFNKRGGLL